MVADTTHVTSVCNALEVRRSDEQVEGMTMDMSGEIYMLSQIAGMKQCFEHFTIVASCIHMNIKITRDYRLRR